MKSALTLAAAVSTAGALAMAAGRPADGVFRPDPVAGEIWR